MKKLLSFMLAICLIALTSIQNSYAVNETLKFGTGFFYPPFVYTDNGGRSVYGFDIELVLAMCKILNDTCIFSQDKLGDNLNKLGNNEIDGTIGAFSITAARKALFDFAGPYFKDSMSYLNLSEHNLRIPQDIPGKKIGVIRNSTFSLYLEQVYAKTITIKTYTSTEDLIQALSEQKIDLILLDTPVANYWAKNSSGRFSFPVGGRDMDAPFDYGYGVAFSQGNPRRVTEFNQALLTLMQNGTYDAIKKRYF